MNRRAAFTALVLLLASPAAWAQTAQEVLAASDAVRNPDRPFGFTDVLTEFRNGKPADSVVLKIYAKAAGDSGQYNSLVQFVEPARDRGKVMLRTGNVLWFYDPSSKSSVRISPQQRLLGQASNGDVMAVNLARDYKATLVGMETIQDGDRQPRECHHLDLAAAAQDVTYHRIEYWVEKGSSRPVKGKFYSESGRLLKTAYYRKYETHLGRERPTETIIIDGVDTGLVTRMQLSAYAYRDMPDSAFQRDALPRFQPE